MPIRRSKLEVHALQTEGSPDGTEVPVPEMPDDGTVAHGDDGDQDVQNRRLKAVLLKLAQDSPDR